jgi:hypothetical protein
MQFKERSAIRTSRKTVKSHAASRSLEDLARRAMPKWRVADDSAQDSDATPEVDAVSPKLEKIQGTSAASRSGKRLRTLDDKISDSPSDTRKKRKSGLVNMVPAADQDSRLGVKTQVFEDDEHTGAQG